MFHVLADAGEYAIAFVKSDYSHVNSNSLEIPISCAIYRRKTTQSTPVISLLPTSNIWGFKQPYFKILVRGRDEAHPVVAVLLRVESH